MPCTKKKVIRVWAESPNLENLNHVEELPMNIPNHRDWSCNMYYIALLHQKLFCFGAYRLNHRIGQQFLLVKSFDTLIQVYARCSTSLADDLIYAAHVRIRTNLEGRAFRAYSVIIATNLRSSKKSTAQGLVLWQQ